MIKRRVVLILSLILCPCFCFASIADDPETINGFLSTGEYAGGVTIEGNEILIVNGGDADVCKRQSKSVARAGLKVRHPGQ